MNDAHDAETTAHDGGEPTPYLRLPWPLVALGLLGLVAVVLVVGLLANPYLRPQVGPVRPPPQMGPVPPPPPPPALAAAPPATALPTPAPAPIAPTPTTDTPTRLVLT